MYSRNIVRTSNGLKLVADLLNNGHDSVVRAAATSIRNLSLDPRNRASLGESKIGEEKGVDCSVARGEKGAVDCSLACQGRGGSVVNLDRTVIT